MTQFENNGNDTSDAYGVEKINPQLPPRAPYAYNNAGYTPPQYTPPPAGAYAARKQRKGVSGGVVAAVAAGCVCFSLLTGALGAAVGYGISQKAVQTQISELRDAMTATQAAVTNKSNAAGVYPSQTSASLSGGMTASDVVSHVRDSVVGITVRAPVTGYGYFGQAQRMQTGSGSGVVISADGYILTNNHVVSGATEVSVMFEDGSSVDAKIIGTDQKTDLAVLKVEKTGLPYATLGTSGALQVGETVIAIGNPLGELNGTVTQGIISATDRTVTFEDNRDMNLLQTDASINGGNSGGALVNMHGEVIGIVVAKSSGIGVEGIGFAIPIDDAKPIIDELINNGYVTQRPKIGVYLAEVTTDQDMWMYGVNKKGVYVAQIEEDSAASEAGLQPGDLVVSFDGQAVASTKELNAIKDAHNVGDSVNMVIERGGEQHTVTITLKEDKPVVEKRM